MGGLPLPDPAAAAIIERIVPRPLILSRRCTVSIVRVGLAETKKFAEGYDAIFGGTKKKTDYAPAAKDDGGAKKKPAKKKKKK